MSDRGGKRGSPSTGPSERAVGRRQFLGRAAVGLGSVSAVLVGSTRAEAGAGVLGMRRVRKIAYRLSTHGRRVCSACTEHAANRFYLSIHLADVGRAHPGCNCGIVPHPLPPTIYNCYFRGKRSVYDRRWKSAHCPDP